MRTSRTTRAVLAVATATTLAVAGCSSEAATDPTTESAQETSDFDISSLDTGGYRVEPRDLVAENFQAGEAGRVIEGQRMAEFVIHPHHIDPTLTVGGGPNTRVSVEPRRLLTSNASELLDPTSVISGFTTYRHNADESRTMVVGVARFTTDEVAAEVVRILHEDQQVDRQEPLESDPSIVLGIPPAVPVTLPGIPTALASTRTWEDLGHVTTTALVPRGGFVVTVFAGDDSGDVEWTHDVVERAARAQLELLEQFPATPAEELAALPMDRDRVMVRAVGFVEGENRGLSDMAVYGPHGWLHFDTSPAHTEKLFEVTGTDRVAKVNSVVYRTAGPSEAEFFRDEFAAGTVAAHPELVEDEAVPQNIPGTRCWSGDIATGRAQRCLMVYGRYVAELSGVRPVGNAAPENDTLRTLPQRLATQYVKFVKAEEMGLGEN